MVECYRRSPAFSDINNFKLTHLVHNSLGVTKLLAILSEKKLAADKMTLKSLSSSAVPLFNYMLTNAMQQGKCNDKAYIV